MEATDRKASPYYSSLVRNSDCPTKLPRLFRNNSSTSNHEAVDHHYSAHLTDRNEPADDVRIDILKLESDDIIRGISNVDSLIHQLMTYGAWEKFIAEEREKQSLSRFKKEMRRLTAQISVQAVGAVAGNALATGGGTAGPPSQALPLVEFATVLGLSLTLAGMSLHRKRRAWSLLMAKIGAVATVSAIIVSMVMHLPLPVAWTVGPAAVFVTTAAVMLAS